MTRSPGDSPVAVDSRTPSGTAPVLSLQASGIDIANVSDGGGVEFEPE